MLKKHKKSISVYCLKRRTDMKKQILGTMLLVGLGAILFHNVANAQGAWESKDINPL